MLNNSNTLYIVLPNNSRAKICAQCADFKLAFAKAKESVFHIPDDVAQIFTSVRICGPD